MFSAPISFSLQYFPVSIAPARPFQCWCLVHSIMFPGYPGCLLVYPCVSLDCVSLCEPPPLQWWRLTLEFCLLEAERLQEAGGPGWKKCWCVLESGLPSAATTTFLINHTFHLSNPPMTGRTKIRHKARTMIKQMVISNKTSGSG